MKDSVNFDQWPDKQRILIALLVATVLAIGVSWTGITNMVVTWFGREEYSHGVLIPFIVLYFIWQKLPALAKHPFTGSWAGPALTLFGILLYIAGELSSLFVVVQYSFLVMLYGVVLSLVGWRAFRIVAIPLLILAFMIPLPNFLYNNLSARLQLLSSELGVWVIRQFNISVYLEGNVIDLGTFKLQVVEACNGLRYLFPLMTLGFVVAYLYHAALWKRAIVFFSTIPITLLMNSFRIGVIGVMVNYWGQGMAEGFLHDFEGWAIFMACFGVLFIEMWLLMRITGDRRPLREVFGLEAATHHPDASVHRMPTVPRSMWVSTLLLVLALGVSQVLPNRQELPPARSDFAEIPLQLGNWKGTPERLEQVYIDALKFTDYALINYHQGDTAFVNFYSAYYASQRKGQSVHSPKSCLPGGGWVIKNLTQVPIGAATKDGAPWLANRALIVLGDQKQLVYYWFQQRGRALTNEYLVKWFIFWDALTRNRTDGSLIRLTTRVPPGDNVEGADSALQSFAQQLVPLIPKFIPD